MQKRNFAKHRHAFTGTHVKTQGIVKGQLKVRDDLPEHLRQGIFKEPGHVYDVAARYANEPIFLQADQEPGPRGLSMKVFNVHGPRLEGIEDSANTQDFFFNNAPSIELTDVDTTLEIMSLRERHFDDPTTLGLKLKLRTDALKQHAPYMLPNTNIISHSLYTQSAFRFGKYYGHMGMFPVRDEQKQSAEPVQKSDPEGILSDRLFDYFQGKEAEYEIKVIAFPAVKRKWTPSLIIVQDTTRYRPSTSPNGGCICRMGRSHSALSNSRHSDLSPARLVQPGASSGLGRSFVT